MAIGGIIYGHIQAPFGAHNQIHLYGLNETVLRTLPKHDDWPPLIRRMFGMAGPDPREGAYDVAIIHYGLSLKGMNFDDARTWLLKFEDLLRRLYWFEAVMHIEWIFEDRVFRWKADEELMGAMCQGGSLMPVDRWMFDDGGKPLTD